MLSKTLVMSSHTSQCALNLILQLVISSQPARIVVVIIVANISSQIPHVEHQLYPAPLKADSKSLRCGKIASQLRCIKLFIRSCFALFIVNRFVVGVRVSWSAAVCV